MIPSGYLPRGSRAVQHDGPWRHLMRRHSFPAGKPGRARRDGKRQMAKAGPLSQKVKKFLGG
jgi:hypothetical protein